MCGIAGIISLRQRLEAEGSALAGFSRQLAHRGPNSHGFFQWAPNASHLGAEPSSQASQAAFVHRRLSIIDESDGGWQPMQSPDERFTLVFNGEIYNYIELRSELEREGFVFRSRSDTEVLLTGFARYGTAFLQKLVGMFAFAFFDSKLKRVTLVRDFFGIKPLYWRRSGDKLLFASELRCLTTTPGGQLMGNSSRALEYLRYGTCDRGTETLFANVHQLAAGAFLSVDLETGRQDEPETYYTPPREDKSWAAEEAAAAVREEFLRSVSIHLRSDVPVGVCLSGGVDSSGITCAIRQLAPQARIQAFTHSASSESLSELKWAALVARHCQADHYIVSEDHSAFSDQILRVLECQEQPFGGISVVAQNSVFGSAQKQGIKVLLDGQGADELFGGYHYFAAARLASLLRQGHYREAVRFGIRASASINRPAAWLWMKALNYILPEQAKLFARRMVGRQLHPSWMKLPDGHVSSFLDPNASPECDVLKSAVYVSLTTSLPNLLRYEDRNSMSYSLESRVPFLTPGLARIAHSLPESLLVDDNGNCKSLLKQAFRGLVPDAILDRKDKIGFAASESSWLQSNRLWVENVVNWGQAANIPFLNFQEVRKNLAAAIAGRTPSTFRLWNILNFILWIRKNGMIKFI